MFDVAVVGAGIVGAATALACARRGLRVVVLERGSVCGETSSTGMGHLMLQPEPEPLARLTLASLELWKLWHRELKTFSLDPCGMLWLAEDDSDRVILERIAKRLEGLAVPIEVLEGAGLLAHEPALAPDLAGGLHCALDAVVVPMRATSAFLAAARERGAAVRTGSPLLNIVRDARGAARGVSTPHGTVECDAVVLATGVWTPEVAALVGIDGVPIRPRAGDLAVTAPHSSPIRMQLLEVRYLASALGVDTSPEASSHALNVQAQALGTCLIGATRRFAGFDRRVDRTWLARSLRRATRFVPALANAPLVRAWAGLRPCSSDRMPLVGEVAGTPGLWLASGHEGLGTTLAPITGEIVAAGLRGEPTYAEAAALSPDRFASLRTREPAKSH